jgi:alkanesulfonate monooxygenase SsuD/methylene tetrahydromethanopterin reductase-like flavin-dependent oxidoreductase (luciferase family)
MKTALFALFENWENDYKKAVIDQLDLIRYCEELGVEETWITEHHFNNFSVIPSPLSIVSYLLGKTKNIKIGTAAILLPLYNLIQLAEEIATIKTFDNERFLYGIAKGAFPIYDKTFHADAATNREAMFEANELIHKLLNEELVTFQGKFFSCEDISIRPKLTEPINTFIASESIEALKEAALKGYGIIGSIAMSKERMRDMFQTYESFYPSKPLSFRVARGINIGFDKEEVLKEAQYCADIFLKSMRASKDTSPTLVKLLTQEYIDIREQLFDSNKLFENAICGTPKECIEQLKALKNEFNIEALLLKPLTTSNKKAKEVMKLYMEEVLPYV